MGKFINPFTDWGFKHIFGQEINKDCLIKFLNDLLYGERHITDLRFKDKEQLAETRDQKGMIYDIYCTTDTGEEIIVEMQNEYQYNFVNRSIYYTARSIISQAKRGTEWRYDMRPVYTVCLMNFGVHENMPRKFRTDVVLTDKETGDIVSGNMRIIYLMLPLFDKKSEAECETDFDCWIYILKNMDILDRMPFTARNAVFKRLAEIANVEHLHYEEREKYEESLKVLRDAYNIQMTAIEEGLAEGFEKGMKEGMKEGMAKGMAEGLTKGMAEGLTKGRMEERAAIVKRLLSSGMPEEQIAEILGISVDELRK